MDVRKLDVGAAAMSTTEEEEALVGKDTMLMSPTAQILLSTTVSASAQQLNSIRRMEPGMNFVVGFITPA